MNHFGLSMALLVILYSSSLNQAASEVYYITPNSSHLCTVRSCLTLTQFAAQNVYLNSNITLIFLPGTHYLNKINLTLSNMDNFTMKSEKSTAQIKCTSISHIHFRQSQSIHITNLEFIGCGGNQVKHIENFVVKDTKFEGQDNSGTALQLIRTKAQIVNVTFASNKKGSYRHCSVIFSRFAYFDRCANAAFIGGAIIATNSTIDISQSKFEVNRADYGGAIFAEQNSIITMSNIVLINNFANRDGGALALDNSAVTINASTFQNNTATKEGSVLYSHYSIITVNASMFQNNSASYRGVLSSYNSATTISSSTFQNNYQGGVLFLYDSKVTINACMFQDNTAQYDGGVLLSTYSIVTIEASEFDSNSAANEGGVLNFHSGTITICGSTFTENNSPIGAVIYADLGTKVQYCNYLLIDNNSANYTSVIHLLDSEFKGCDSGNITFSNNLGSLMAHKSNITFNGYINFVNNQLPQTASDLSQKSTSAIILLQSNIFFGGKCNLEHNHAENGGAIHSTESKLYVNGNVTIAHNTATGNGGGVYLSTSELNCQQKSTFLLLNNTAAHKGGGLHAISSSIKAIAKVQCSYDFCYDDHRYRYPYIGSRITFTDNTANWGGGLSLEANAKLYILKYNSYDGIGHDANTTVFIGNRAAYGGAVYVDDDTNSGTCDSDTKTECFFQALALYNARLFHGLKTQSIYFSKNSADISGSTLYGGLLDRCAVSQFAEFWYKISDLKGVHRDEGIAYFRNVSIATNMSISSRPVRICVCTNSTHDCTNNRRVHVKKGEAFTVLLRAVDQVGQPVNATIQISLNFTESGLAEGQLAKKIPAKCTNLTFNVVSAHDSETLALYICFRWSMQKCRTIYRKSGNTLSLLQLSNWIRNIRNE